MTAKPNTPIEIDTDIDAGRLAALKQLALIGGFDHETTLSCDDLGDRLDVSTSTARGHLRELATAGHIIQRNQASEQRIRLTESGRRLLTREYDQYRRLFDDQSGLVLDGTVEDGLGEGKHYISLPGYVEQFEERLGYTPFAGTLNVELDERSARYRDRLTSMESVDIDAWSDDDRTYGSASCYPVVVEATEGVDAPAHVLVPDRTHHDPDLLEVIAPTKLRASLGLSAGSGVRLRVLE